MRKISYSIDNLLQMLRHEGVYRLEDIHFALVEANGELSVKLKPEKEMAKVEHVQPIPQPITIEYPVIIDGRLHQEALAYNGLNEAWLREELLKMNVADIKEVFYAAVNEQNKLHVSLCQPEQTKTVPIFH
jgi:uncharacterized membrane protein YcaP (DUF421 family)